MKVFNWQLRTLLLLMLVGVANAYANCITFESPLAGSELSTPSCTISLNVECRNVSKVDLQARYTPEHSDSQMIASLGTISRPPYKLIWNIDNLQNQLFTGIGILAEAAITGGSPQVARQEGIFFTHRPIERKRIPIPYAPGNNHSAAGDAYAQYFHGISDPQKSAWGAASWNEKELCFYVSVKDPSFYNNQPGRNIANEGLEIMIDPTRKRAPYPSENTLVFVVPLSGAPYSVRYKTEIADGAFKPTPQPSSRIDYPYNVDISEFKGYNFRLSVPKGVFGKAIPDTISCNMALRILDESGKVQKVSLTGDNVYDMYSPFTWNDYYRLPKPPYYPLWLLKLVGDKEALDSYTKIMVIGGDTLYVPHPDEFPLSGNKILAILMIVILIVLVVIMVRVVTFVKKNPSEKQSEEKHEKKE